MMGDGNYRLALLTFFQFLRAFFTNTRRYWHIWLVYYPRLTLV
jgi:hypothetical protein